MYSNDMTYTSFGYYFSKTIKWLKRCYRKKILKETAEQKAAMPGWEKDYQLNDAMNTSLYHEYLEMGMSGPQCVKSDEF